MNNTSFQELWISLKPVEKENLAKAAKTSAPYLSQIANGHRNAGWPTIQNLVAADNRISYSMFEGQAA